MASELTPTTATRDHVRNEMADEGRRLVDAARSAGVALRLLGGLAVREHCRSLELCERDYSDLDMVALARQTRHLVKLFAGIGYAENYDVSLATGGSKLQFVRPCTHGDDRESGPAHADDHVDVFLDSFRMDHVIALARRLEIEPYTISLSDLLVTKLQIFRPEEKDLRDIVTLLGDTEVGEGDASGLINSRYIGELCADDWGLFYDVVTNLQRVDEEAAVFDLSPAQVARVHDGIMRLVAAIDVAPKNLTWRLRARVGVRKMWHIEITDQE